MDEGKDWLTTLLLAIFLGGFGVHRFYTGHIGIGIAQLLTLGGCGIWSLIDIIMIATGSFKDAEGNALIIQVMDARAGVTPSIRRTAKASTGRAAHSKPRCQRGIAASSRPHERWLSAVSRNKWW